MNRLTGQAIHEAVLAVTPTVNKPWCALCSCAKLKYEQMAQLLEIQLGILPATTTEYFFVYGDNVIQSSDLRAVMGLIIDDVDPGDFFDVVLFQGGAEVGVGRYQLTEDRYIHEMKVSGEARYLLPVLSEE